MKKTFNSLGVLAVLATPTAKVMSVGYEEYVVLPIKEPWASMIADGIKPFEFRSWMPKWKKGKKILIVATGKAESPRKIIALATYGGTGYVINIRPQTLSNQQKCLFIKADKDKPFLAQENKKFRRITNNEILEWGGNLNDNAIKLDYVTKIKPILLSDLGIMRTPQKYQYWKGDIDNLTKWDVNK